MAKNLMVCANSNKALKRINESEGVAVDKYVLEGVFAELDKLNRNKRIYPKDEYLKHLSYLRDDIKKNGGLLGELDHPEDRFEVKIKEASHVIKDLWYDESSNCVMGKIELLNTPNGLIAKSLVDQGIPLHISSRAAGTVGNDSKVNIQQIYTYDLVCKPGFAGAVLHRVNESEDTVKYNKVTNEFLAESNRQESLNVAGQFGFNNEDMSIREIASDVKLRKEAVAIKENSTDVDVVENKVNEPVVYVHADGTPVDMEFVNAKVDELIEAGIIEDGKVIFTDQVDTIVKDNEGFYYINPAYIEDMGDEVEIEIGEYIGESLKGHKRSTHKPILKSVFEGDDDNKESEKDSEDAGADDADSDKDGEKTEGVEILSISIEVESDSEETGVEIKDINTETTEDSDDDSSDKEDNHEDKPDSDDKKDEGCSKEGEECDKTPKNALFDCNSIKNNKTKFEEEFAELVDTIKRKGEKKKADESLTITKYPSSAMFTESNFDKFVKLDETQKSNVAAYLRDMGCSTPESINENWKNGLDYNSEQEVWLKYAPAEYKKLYESSRDEVKNAIRNCASYVLFENQNDINTFWYNCTILESEQRRLSNQDFINNVPKINESTNNDNGLPYSQEFIDRVKIMAMEYNN